MANVYDMAYALEKAIRDSDDFKRLKQLYENVNNDPSSKRLFDSFRETQFELQQKQMMGEDISEQDIQKAEQQFTLIGQHEGIAQLMQAEERMSMIINDVTRVVMKPLEELYGAPEGLQ